LESEHISGFLCEDLTTPTTKSYLVGVVGKVIKDSSLLLLYGSPTSKCSCGDNSRSGQGHGGILGRIKTKQRRFLYCIMVVPCVAGCAARELKFASEQIGG
jgi:hypothetical protein